MIEGFWYHALIPEASRRGLARTIGTNALKCVLHAAGFSNISRAVPLDALLQGQASLDQCGPLDPGWRAGDSIWALASHEELSAATSKVRDLEKAGALEDFLEAHDRARHAIGQTTFWCAVKAS